MRASGVLMGISSIPSKYGIGCFSREAYEFVDQLSAGGQQYWQILPLDLQDMEILRISQCLLLQEILILSAWKT